MFYLCESKATATTTTKRLIGRPHESAQSERKSTPRYGDDPLEWILRKKIQF